MDPPVAGEQRAQALGRQADAAANLEHDPSIFNLGKAAAPDGRLIAADGLSTPFADETFPLAIVFCVLHHLPVDRRTAFLAEAARITRRGGLVLLCEHIRGIR